MDHRFEDLFYRFLERDYESNGNFGFLSHMSVLVIKSLLPFSKRMGSGINYERYIKELNLWTSYRSAWNKPLEEIEITDYERYWTCEDQSIIYRMLPIIIVNEDLDLIEDELIKNILFTTARTSSIFENILIANFIFYYLQGKDEEFILDHLKSRVIALEQLEFLEAYSGYFRLVADRDSNNYKIEFEKEKIKILNILNSSDEDGYDSLQDLYKFLTAGNYEAETDLGIVLERIEKSSDYSVNIPNFYKELYKYMLMLRKTRIDPKDIIIEEYIEPDIFSFSEGDSFFHSLLNQSRIVKKSREGNLEKSLVQSRSGYYLFTRSLN